MRILLSTLNAKYIHSSLALAYLDSCCRNENWTLGKREYTINEPLAHILADIHHFQPDILCFSTYIWNVEPVLEICNDYKKIAPQTLIILGGPEVSYDAATTLRQNPSVDCIIRDEGEYALREVLTNIYSGKGWAEIKGLSCRDNTGIRENPGREPIADLDRIPSPYDENNIGYYGNRTVYFETSRGCPYNCAYCLSSLVRGVRFFSLERVKKDLRFLMSAGVKEIKFVDRTFNCHEKRAIEIMRFIVRENRNSKFHFEICADLISEEMLTFLQDIPPGIFDFEIGIQSTFPAALQAVNRSMNWDKLARNIGRLKSLGAIHLHLDLIAGLPWEDYQTFAGSFNDVYHLAPEVIQLGFLKLLKGSKIRRECERHDYVFQAKPPYQVLANKYITYAELVRLTEIEDLLDRYYNSGSFSHTLKYIMEKIYQQDAFAFFEEFSGFWLNHNLLGIGLKKDKEYTHLKQFIDQYHEDHSCMVNELLKLDFLLTHNSSSLPESIVSFNPSDNSLLYSFLKDEAFLDQYLPACKDRSPREIRRYVHLEQMRYDLESGELTDTPVYILFCYDAVTKKSRQVWQLHLQPTVSP